jgi:hypothetical protein
MTLKAQHDGKKQQKKKKTIGQAPKNFGATGPGVGITVAVKKTNAGESGIQVADVRTFACNGGESASAA